MSIIIETNRLYLRTLDENDFAHLKKLFQDELIMAFEHSFSDDEINQWLAHQIEQYEKEGFGLWAVIEKSRDAFIGECGLSKETINGDEYLELEYVLHKRYWHKGYATEMAAACRDYAFHTLNAKKINSIIHIDNIASNKVAKRIGMKIEKEIAIKNYYGNKIRHYVYSMNSTDA
jgi:RimJ/RimL family protein N-acetyltransferase